PPAPFGLGRGQNKLECRALLDFNEGAITAVMDLREFGQRHAKRHSMKVRVGVLAFEAHMSIAIDADADTLPDLNMRGTFEVV
ncbi:hypothetical protein, partial [Yoonia sp. R2-816]|uniref:hypothetical protein n=1 Tax=Yoonia sp. R2-816 TaxID=3342638 RepID=UPI00372BB5EF